MASSSPPSFARTGELIVMAVDALLEQWAGPGAALPEPWRSEAAKEWSAALELYVPKILELGPLGNLAAIYLTHGSALYMTRMSLWTTAQSQESSENAEAERRAS